MEHGAIVPDVDALFGQHHRAHIGREPCHRVGLCAQSCTCVLERGGENCSISASERVGSA